MRMGNLSEHAMKFDRELLKAYVVSLLISSKPDLRFVGHNFLIEENVSDERRLELELHEPNAENAREFMKSYYKKYVQGVESGHIPSSFIMHINYPALEPVVVDPSEKLVRLENIDRFIVSNANRIKFDALKKALDDGDNDILSLLARSFHAPIGQRPMFAAFERDVRFILRKHDWLPRIIDIFGLLHHYHSGLDKPKFFALMECTAAEVIEQARAKGIVFCFALPTVLESQGNPAFCPVPRSSTCGRSVDLRVSFPDSPIGEILHARFDYQPRHIKLLGVWRMTDIPDIKAMRELHLVRLREQSGWPDFGSERKMR